MADYEVTDDTADMRVGMIRARHEKRVKEGLVGGVQEWFEIAFLLKHIKEVETDWEYSIKVVYPSGNVDIYEDWNDRRHIEADLLWFRSDDALRRLRNAGCMYSLVRRRKAGPVEDVD